jgi:hypothetical protein
VKQCDYLIQSGTTTTTCYPCATSTEITTSTLANCMSVANVRFFTYTITHNSNFVDDPKKYYLILEFQNFDKNTNLMPSLKSWLQTKMRTSASLTPYTPSFVFDAIDPARAPTGDSKIQLPFKMILGSKPPSDSLFTLNFFTSNIINSANIFNVAQMISQPNINARVCNQTQ